MTFAFDLRAFLVWILVVVVVLILVLDSGCFHWFWILVNQSLWLLINYFIKLRNSGLPEGHRILNVVGRDINHRRRKLPVRRTLPPRRRAHRVQPQPA